MPRWHGSSSDSNTSLDQWSGMRMVALNRPERLARGCVVCGYALAGHDGPFRCPECGTRYDDESNAWYSAYTTWHFRSRGGYAQIMLGSLTVIWYFQLQDPAPPTTFLLLCLYLAAFCLMFVMRRVYLRRGWNPFIAVTPDGLVINRSGRPNRVESKSWEAVVERLKAAGRPWKYGPDVARSLRVALDIRASRELFQAMQSRIASQANDGGVRGQAGT